jgi:hypothetical protein
LLVTGLLLLGIQLLIYNGLRWIGGPGLLLLLLLLLLLQQLFLLRF